MSDAELAKEWGLMQAQYDSYEKYSLIIKLVSVSLVGLASMIGADVSLLLVLLLVLWLQDGIWKTFQGRIEDRLLLLEKALAGDTKDVKPCQFNSEFMLNRKSGGGLIKEYLSQSLRPTVAFPHVVLVLITVVTLFWS